MKNEKVLKDKIKEKFNLTDDEIEILFKDNTSFILMLIVLLFVNDKKEREENVQ